MPSSPARSVPLWKKTLFSLIVFVLVFGGMQPLLELYRSGRPYRR